ncbi:MAG: hypothetical protein ACYTKD_09785 [Planctomycetota bacterium]|jgi:hypothetical protein
MRRRIGSRAVAATLLACAVARIAGAQAPTLINFQGKLVETDGTPVAGPVDIVFSIHDHPTDVNVVWTETHLDVTVTKGLFSVLLGGTDPINPAVLDHTQCWLEMTVEGEPMLPRQRLVSVAFAQVAADADTLDGLDSTVFWQLGGNAGTDTGTEALGTTGAALELHVGSRVLRLAPETAIEGPNVLAGYAGNVIGVTAFGATISGGGDPDSTDAGGAASPNSVQSDYGTVSGGRGNETTGFAATIGGGQNNLGGGSSATVGGGSGNQASGNTSTIGGGVTNSASSNASVVAGGSSNTAQSANSAVGGGNANTAAGLYSTISGGRNNVTAGAANYAAIGGGWQNWVNSVAFATIAGGNDNTVLALGGTVGGGGSNGAFGQFSTVGGGASNDASGDRATVAGGQGSTASGYASTVPGGANNIAAGDYSFAAGRRAKAQSSDAVPVPHAGTFIWADATNEDFNSTADNQFLIRASGNVGIGTNAPAEQLSVAGVVESTSGGFRFPDGTLQTSAGYTQAEVDALLASRDATIADLQAQIDALSARVTGLELDHFTVTCSAGPLTVAEAYTITITVRDRYGNAVPNYVTAHDLALDVNTAGTTVTWAGGGVTDGADGSGTVAAGTAFDGSGTHQVTVTNLLAESDLVATVTESAEGQTGASAAALSWQPGALFSFSGNIPSFDNKVGWPVTLVTTALDVYGNPISGYAPASDITLAIDAAGDTITWSGAGVVDGTGGSGYIQAGTVFDSLGNHQALVTNSVAETGLTATVTLSVGGQSWSDSGLVWVATYSHTISIDGVNDFVAGDETFGTTSGTTAYLTYDADKLYIGLDDPAVASGNPDIYLLIYIGGRPGSESGDGVEYREQRALLNFEARYCIYYRFDDTAGSHVWNDGAGAWEDVGGAIGLGHVRNGSYLEMSIPFADIGYPDPLEIHMSVVTTTFLSEWTASGVPDNSFVDSVNPVYKYHYTFYTVDTSPPAIVGYTN